MSIIQRRESEVRSYCRSFPTIFDKADGAKLYDIDGRGYIDFFAGAGTLNYGHNNPVLREALTEYIAGGGVTHSLDMTTAAKVDLLASIERYLLEPRGLDYKVMFPGPTGTNSVEAALKLARKVTGREDVIAFTNGFHGMTLGSLAVTGNQMKRDGAGIALGNAVHMPFDGYLGDGIDTVDAIERMILDPSSGVAKPAAFILETVQAEGGVNVSSFEWQQKLAKLAKAHDILLIVDDIQVGCGRTGPFLSFEPAGIEPDILCLSKSLSGYGLPFALTLFKRDLDVWAPGEHNGTFRGHNLAFVTARTALETYWADDELTKATHEKAELAKARLERIAQRTGGHWRGRGLIQGVAMPSSDLADAVTRAAFEHGLVIETAGASGEVVKLLPPLVISKDELTAGLDILDKAVDTALANTRTSGVTEASA